MNNSLPPSPSTPDLCPSPMTTTSTSTSSGYLVSIASTRSFTPGAVIRSSNSSSSNNNTAFFDLHVPPEEFRPSASLTTGQSFHWTTLTNTVTPSSADALDREEAANEQASSPVVTSSSLPSPSAWGSHDATDWIGTLRVTKTGQTLVVHVRETPTTTLYKVLALTKTTRDKSSDGGDDTIIIDTEAFLREYFQLPTSLSELYTNWSQACPRLAQIGNCIPGVRILQQDPWETLLSFICSSNNNIPRITQILATLRKEYGQRIVVRIADGDSNDADDEQHYYDHVVYTFPSLQDMQDKATEADLRRLGWGYRAKYVMKTIETLQSLGGEAYLASLRQETDPVVVQEALLQFAGVGRKVADCVALFSLGQTRAIPVDVHVWNIARRDYDPKGALASVKSLTPTIYKQVGDIFRNRFGEYAGWAHSLLFVAELPSFRPVLPETLIQEMQEFRESEQARKQEMKQAKQKK